MFLINMREVTESSATSTRRTAASSGLPAPAPNRVLAASFESRGAIVYYDRPLDDSATNAWIGMTIEYGDHVRAGDRFESFRPGYQVVKEQPRFAEYAQKAPGREIPVVVLNEIEPDTRPC